MFVSTNSTFAAGGHREYSAPTAWTTTSITFTFHEGSWDTGSDTVYVYVRDSNGDVNANGLQLTTSGGGSPGEETGGLFWIASTAEDWNDTANWSYSSGGSTCNCLPLSTHSVVFNANGNGNSTVDLEVDITSLTVSGYTGTLDFDGFEIGISSQFVQTTGTVDVGTSILL